MATAMKNAATRWPKDSRWRVAVNLSPVGGSPEGVVSAGFAVAVGFAPGAGLTGVAASSGIRVTLLRLRSTAAARNRTFPPLVHATSPASAPVLLL